VTAQAGAVAASYRDAEEVSRRRARNFYYSFVVLPAEKRRALCAVYAFMRECDDISDGEAPVETKQASLRAWRDKLDAALQGTSNGHPLFPAFHDAARRYAIPPQYFHWVIDGAEMDLVRTSYDTFDELYRYCFHVASAVGLVCLQIFGFSDARATTLAESCGIAFQLTNILRDVKEDADMGRIYLPMEDLARFHYGADELRRGVFDVRFGALADYEATRASRYYAESRELLELVEPSSRPALWAMMEIYSRVLRKIVRRGYDVFTGSARLSNSEKAVIALQALVQRFGPGRIGAR
jgi:phytoene synthase